MSKFINFEGLVKNRKDWVKLSEKNDFNFNDILTGLYNDPSHFIFELLQNAEDEKANKVCFELYKDRLDVYHNGKPFTLEDVEGVTGIGNTKKKTDLTSIGKFGVGFKSVFAITESPSIFSGAYNFEIKDFVVPNIKNPIPIKMKTLIRLPFNHNVRSPEEIYELIFEKLNNLNLKSLLFLNNIKKIKWKSVNDEGEYSRISKELDTKLDSKKVTLTSSKCSNNGNFEKYIVIGKKLNDSKLKIEVAYKLGQNKEKKEIIIPERNANLVVYFPTEKVTFLNFIIQGPYKTTISRENIPLNESENKEILNETATLVSDSLLIIKKLGYLDVNFLKILPISSEPVDKETIYSIIYNTVKNKLINSELLPTSKSEYAKANEVSLAREKELTNLLSGEDLTHMFGKKYWLSTEITYDKTRDLRDYLINVLSINEVNFEGFSRKISKEFIEKKSDKWMIDLYRNLINRHYLFKKDKYNAGALINKPILRLDNGKHIAPYNNEGDIQAYLPVATKSEYDTVKEVFSKDKDSLEFLKKLGLTKPDTIAEIKKYIIPKYNDNSIKDKSYFSDFEKILRAYEEIASDKQKDFIGYLSDKPFILSYNNYTSERKFSKPKDTYSNEKDLKKYFKGYNSVCFVSDEVYKRFDKDRLNRFFYDLGVENKPRRIEVEPSLTMKEKEKLRKNENFTDENLDLTKDYDLEGLDNFLLTITKKRSLLLWELLKKIIKNLNPYNIKQFFKGKYVWFYYHEKSSSFDSKFLKKLKTETWLINKNCKFKKPTELTSDDLHENYLEDIENMGILFDILEFESDIYNKLPNEIKKKLDLVKDISEEELKKIITEIKYPKEDNEVLSRENELNWEPEIGPDLIDGLIKELDPKKLSTKNLSGQFNNLDGNKNSEKQDVEILSNEKHESDLDKKAIGRWGEEYVYNTLVEKMANDGEIIETNTGFIVRISDNEELEVVWLNSEIDKGKGYDFVLVENGIEIKYIEVKTRTGGEKELINATGTQWEFARKLYEQGHGDLYYFYVVSNAGTKNAGIYSLRNPIELWKKGKIYAHPIQFKL